MRLWPALAVLLVAGCIEGLGSTEPILVGSFAGYADEVQPVLARRCANPSCHGTLRRPLEIYAPLQHRSDPDQLFVDGPLTNEELRHNYTRTCMFLRVADAAEECELVTKPLAPAAGGIDHSGIVVFEGLDDPELALLVDWIDEALVIGGRSP